MRTLGNVIQTPEKRRIAKLPNKISIPRYVLGLRKKIAARNSVKIHADRVYAAISMYGIPAHEVGTLLTNGIIPVCPQGMKQPTSATEVPSKTIAVINIRLNSNNRLNACLIVSLLTIYILFIEPYAMTFDIELATEF